MREEIKAILAFRGQVSESNVTWTSCGGDRGEGKKGRIKRKEKT